MKKSSLIFIFTFSIIMLTSCKKTDKVASQTYEKTAPLNYIPIIVPEANTAFYGKFTAIWCRPCGEYGWELNDSIIAEIEDKAIAMGIYSELQGSTGDRLAISSVAGWYGDFGVKGYPSFIVNGINENSYTVGQSTKSNVMNAINKFVGTPVEIAVGGNLIWTGQKLTVNAAVKCFKVQKGDFFVGAYMIEDKVKSTQVGQSGVVEHRYVCRGSMFDWYGYKFIGLLTAGAQTDASSCEYDVPSEWKKENMSVALIIWKKEPFKYTFVNATWIK